MLIDSVSIILLTVPIFAPIAAVLGIDPLAFAIFGILVIEAGLLTPPFGLLVYTVKGSVPDPTATLSKIFIGSFPYFLLILAAAFIVLFIPQLANWVTSNHVAMTDETAVRFSIVTCPHHFCSSSPFGTGAGISCTQNEPDLIDAYFAIPPCAHARCPSCCPAWHRFWFRASQPGVPREYSMDSLPCG